mmetsp:Transcript_5523/g.7783  ORF Transcript_5523/g.7783 Transcript_5523/m.7783 type:complete len:590 (-) Transcript_5523:355-2124(-)
MSLILRTAGVAFRLGLEAQSWHCAGHRDRRRDRDSNDRSRRGDRLGGAGLGQRRLVHGELDGVRFGERAQVVHAGLEALLPGVEVHRGESGSGGLGHVDVERLRLADEGPAVRRLVDDGLLLDLPHRLVQLLDVLRDHSHLLHAAAVRDDLVAHLRRPQSLLHQLLQQVLVHHRELAGQHAAIVHVRGEGLRGLVVAEYLCGGGGGHGGQHERVPEAVLRDAGSQRRPVPATLLGGHLPEVLLQQSLRGGRARVRGVGAVQAGQLAGGREGREVHGLEDLAVQLRGLRAFKGHAHLGEGVRESLHSDADGAVAEVGVLGLENGVEVDVDDLVEVLGDHLGDLKQLLEVEGLVRLVHEGRQIHRGQVADRHLLRGGELHDLRAQVGRADGAQVLLVGLAVAGVLVHHVGRAGLHLRRQDGEPQLLRGHRAARLALPLVLLVQRLELLAPHIRQPFRLVRAEERPRAVLLYSLHEQVRDPQSVEQVPGAVGLVAVVLLQVQEVHDVCVPGLEVDGDGALPLAAALVHVSGGVIVHAQHGHDAVGAAVGATDVGVGCTDVVDGQADAACVLGDDGALLQCVVDAVNTVILHR